MRACCESRFHIPTGLKIEGLLNIQRAGTGKAKVLVSTQDCDCFCHLLLETDREVGKVIEHTKSMRILSEYVLGEITVRYRTDGTSVGLVLFPKDTLPTPRRRNLAGVAIEAYAAANHARFPAENVDSMVQVKVIGDDAPASFSSGRTMRNSQTVRDLSFADQTVKRTRGGILIRTTFRHRTGWLAHHDLSWTRGTPWLQSVTLVENTTNRPLDLELLSSFSISGITPFAEDDAHGRLVLHRFRSVWSMEGRTESRPLEDLQLEPSWSGWGARCERFGVTGSMPCNGFFPCAALEDTVAGVVWGVQLAHNASWQLEVYRRDDGVALSGGLADREFGHWIHRLKPGNTFASPVAILSCVRGSLDDCCAALVASQKPALRILPRIESKLPVIFNEWATTWGKPSHENMIQLADKLRGLGITYLVMDAGWYAPPEGNWSMAHGDWIPAKNLYPEGLRATAKSIRKAGFIPGIWFEMETCGRESRLFHKTDLLLHRDGIPLTVGERRFLDLRNPRAVRHLTRKLIDRLRQDGFGYLKVDYNETTGLGFDGAESLGESQRLQAESSRAFFGKLRKELPDLVIENCSSGGHRLEPSMLALTSMSSFSDAHECLEIPIIAANLHRLMLPQQSQIWAVIRSGEPPVRTSYSLAAGFLGRLCLSGDALQWTEAQRSLVREAIAVYRQAVPVLRDGRSHIHGPPVCSYRHPKGWQAVVRVGSNGDILSVIHTFSDPMPFDIPLPGKGWIVFNEIRNAANSNQGPTIAGFSPTVLCRRCSPSTAIGGRMILQGPPAAHSLSFKTNPLEQQKAMTSAISSRTRRC